MNEYGFLTPPRAGPTFTYLAPPEMLPGTASVFAGPDPILPHLQDPRIAAEYQRRMEVLHRLIKEGDRLATYVSSIADYNNDPDGPEEVMGVVKDLRNAAGDYESVRFRTIMQERQISL